MTTRPDDPRTIEELIRVALDGSDEETAWEAIGALHFRGTEGVLLAAQRLCSSVDPKERSRGADILGQLGVPTRTFPEECLATLIGLLHPGQDSSVLYSAAIALGHLRDERAVTALVALKNHQSADVRYGVVFGLLGARRFDAIAALVELSQDPDDHVRDWATFGLGSEIDADTPAIRLALYERTSDSSEETRAEALIGLARRHDPRVVELVAKELSAGYRGSLDLVAEVEDADPELASLLRSQLDRQSQ